MKKLSFIRLPIFLMIVVFLIATSAYASNPVPQNNYVSSLTSLNILRGNYSLESKVKRAEFISWVVRAMGYDQDIDISKMQMSCKDVKKTYWAYDNLKIALNFKFIDVYPNNTLRPDENITSKDALVILIRALGYGSDILKSSYEEISKESTSLGLINDVTISDSKSLTHGQAYILIYNFLTSNLNA